LEEAVSFRAHPLAGRYEVLPKAVCGYKDRLYIGVLPLHGRDKRLHILEATRVGREARWIAKLMVAIETLPLSKYEQYLFGTLAVDETGILFESPDHLYWYEWPASGVSDGGATDAQ
jgi:hypothetical protein